MKMFHLSHYALPLWVCIAVLSGCASPSLDGASAGGFAQQVRPDQALGRSWMKPGTSGESLLYVSIPGDRSEVVVYSYPQGELVGTLTSLGEPVDLCTDVEGNVFIPTRASSGGSTIHEYAHGGTSPIATLNDPGEASGCGVDPKNGNLAVTNSSDSSNPYYDDYGDVAIYAEAQGNPQMYYSSEINGFGDCGYDDVGNLYFAAGLAGEKYQNQISFARLSGGSSTFSVIELNKKLYTYGPTGFYPSVQWDGKHMTVTTFSGSGSQGIRSANLPKSPVLLYRLSITGSSGTVIGTTTLDSKKNHHGGQSWITGKNIVGIYYHGYNVGIWRYPQGGEPQRTIHNVGGPPWYRLWGVTVSVAPSH